MCKYFKTVSVGISVLILVGLFAGAAFGEQYTIAFSSVPSITDIPLEIAFEHLRELGYDFQPVYFDRDDVATAAVASGNVDFGMGLPFPAIEQGADLRIFMEGRGMEFLAVVSTEFESWQDLDGEVIYTHSRASTTTSMARFIEKQEGMKFASINFLPGSEVRAVALMRGDFKATILDLTNTRVVLDEAPGQFRILPFGEADASTESFTTATKFLEEHPDVVRALITEVLKVYRRGVADYTYLVEEAGKYNVLPDLPDRDQMGELLQVSIAAGVFDPNGAITPKLAVNNFELYVAGGLMEGPAEDLKVEDFYDFTLLNAVLDELGRVTITVSY